jgi:alkanesulfonate monooxygenase SsuD/methylene tetrahydromethanopterin reductase-like flavin-dependent oxidoreductase (luciferase family)
MRELITLDDISDGRFILGVGAGAGGTSYDALVFGEPDLPTKARVDRFTEFVEALDGLLLSDKFDYQGAFYKMRGARNVPGSVQRPRLPFLIAANGPRTMTLAARFGAAWATTGGKAETLDEWWAGIAQLSATFDDKLDQVGRDRSSVLRYLSLDAAPVFSLSSVDAFTDAAGRAAELGFTDIVTHWPRSEGEYEGREQTLEKVADEVLPGLQAGSNDD